MRDSINIFYGPGPAWNIYHVKHVFDNNKYDLL